MTELKHITFYIDGLAEKFDTIEQMIKDHDITEYLISHELLNSKGKEKPHYHFILLTTDKIYNNLFKKLKVALGVKPHKATGSGGYRPYGRLKQPIRDLDRLKIYCSKDGNVRSTYPKDVLEALHERSFKKNKDDQFKLDLIEHLDQSVNYNNLCNREKLYGAIIQFLILKDMKISRPGIISWATFYISKTGRFASDISGPTSRSRIIYNLLF